MKKRSFRPNRPVLTAALLCAACFAAMSAISWAEESTATTVPQIIHEMLLTRTSERHGRVIDRDEEASMEKKKREGYF